MRKVDILKRPIILLGLIFIFFSIVTLTVFAAYSFTRNVEDEDVTIGDVTVDSKSFLSYAKYKTDSEITALGIETNSIGYYAAKKMRIDTLCILEGFQMKASYARTNISSFAEGVRYYTFDETSGKYTLATAYVAGTTYYIATYVLNDVKTAYDASVHQLSVTVDSNTITASYNSTTVAILTVTIDSSTGLLTSVTSVKKSQSVDGNLRAIIGSDYLSITVIDDDLITDQNQPSSLTVTGNTANCYASIRNKNDSRINYESPYLNQLGLGFEFTVKIPVYVRIHIQDAWISTQFLSSRSERVRYISKDKISGSSPFSVTDSDWYYDVDNNIAYYKNMFMPVMSGENFLSQQFVFNVNEGYYYYDKSAQAASKITTVQVSFTIDIVQANRAEELWDVNFEELFS